VKPRAAEAGGQSDGERQQRPLRQSDGGRKHEDFQAGQPPITADGSHRESTAEVGQRQDQAGDDEDRPPIRDLKMVPVAPHPRRDNLVGKQDEQKTLPTHRLADEENRQVQRRPCQQAHGFQRAPDRGAAR